MRINILDAGLRNVAGHHFEYDRKLAKRFSELGHEVRVYGYADMSDQVERELLGYGKVEKLFRSFHYEFPIGKDRYAGEFILYDDHTRTLVDDLKQVEEADLWIWPTLLAQQLNACAQLAGVAPVVGCIHEDPGIEQRTAGAMLWRHAMVEAQRRRLRSTLGTVGPEIRHRFMSILPDGRFALFPEPHDGPAIPEAKTSLRRIGFLGHLRLDKGRDLLGPLTNRLISEGYDILVQDSEDRMKVSEHPQVELLGHVDNMRDAVARCDLVVLSYDVDSYRRKGSGILSECLAAGVPVVGPFGTIPGQIIEQWGVGQLFAHNTEAGIFAAIQSVHRNYALIAASAFRAASRYARHNGTDRFAKALLRFA
ncbi:MAG: glycosyltransferase [Novosphingobium sp.]|nr:glycosyltransferase [Novosphingobium sp.]MCP5404098.1 glycosyltransferase [Novosphingobium sp.]